MSEQYRVPCACSESLATELSMHSRVSKRNLPYFIEERRVPPDVDREQLHHWYEQAQATDRSLVACNQCRSLKFIGETAADREVLTGPAPR